MLVGVVSETDLKTCFLQKMQRQTDGASNIVGNLAQFFARAAPKNLTD
jgi:hypothetical protein